MKNNLYFTTLLVAGLGFLLPVYGGVVTYSDSATYLAAGTNFGTITFTSIVSGASQLLVTPGFPQGSSQYYFTQHDSGTFTEYASLGASEFGNNSVLLYTGTQYYIGVPGGVNGLGLNIGCYPYCDTGSPSPIAQILVYGSDQTTLLGTYSNIPSIAGATTFWGVRSDAAIGLIAINYGQIYSGLDNVSVGGAATSSGSGPTDTPEAATLILIGSGLAVMAKWRRFGHSHPAI